MVDRVFVVEQGEYSDRDIIAIFDNQEEFEAFCVAHEKDFEATYDAMYASIWPVSHCAKAEHVKSHIVYGYQFYEAPDQPMRVHEVTPIMDMERELKNDCHRFCWYEHKQDGRIIKSDKSCYNIYVYLDELNDEKATKIAAEMLAVEKAKVEGIA